MLVTNFHEISLIGRKIDRTLMTPVASVQRHKGGGGGCTAILEEIQDVRDDLS